MLAKCFSIGLVYLAATTHLLGATIRHDEADQATLTQGAASQYLSVGLVRGPGYTGSGVYLGNRLVLTAGHVTGPSGGRLKFEVNGRSIAATRAADHPSWNGSLISGVDLGIFELAQEPGVAAATVNFGQTDPFNQPATLVGFGLSGDGRTGQTSFDGRKRAARNTLDAPRGAFFGRTDILVADFDSPNRDRFSSSGSPEPLQREGLTTSGDSGGGIFVQSADRWLLTAITSFGWQDPKAPDGKWSNYGDRGGYVDITRHTGWLRSYLEGRGSWRGTNGLAAATTGDIIPLISTTIPEPTCGLVLALAAGTLFAKKRLRYELG